MAGNLDSGSSKRSKSNISQIYTRLSQSYQGLLDKTVPWVKARWLFGIKLVIVFLARILLTQGWYIVAYALGIYHLNLFISFLTPKMDPALDFDAEENGPELPMRANEEFRPFIRRLPEFKFWMNISELGEFWPIIQALIVLAVVGIVTIVSVIKFYNVVTCSKFRDSVKMDGKTVIVTGATGGIGKETARELAKRGARVILACRNVENGEKVRAEIQEETKNDKLVVRELDLSSQKSIRGFAEAIISTEERLDVLVHNAGTAEKNLVKTEDGLELTMATNHFGPFLLTHLLIDLLKRSAPSRIVVVASSLYQLASLNLDNLNPSSSWFPPYIYYPSKYANICFTLELARRLEGTGVTANCLHPGLIDSGIWRNVPVPLNWPLKLIVKGFFKTPQQGCQTSLYLTCSDEVKNVSGKYFMECREHSLNRGASDMAKAGKLWELSKELTKLKPTDPTI
ncbi:hypothetical protein HUJ05_008316 [Dendroctonus ponderosae]|nr:hypothetical protein HUJ05_008316 [Dendroctonus ponderosae]